MTDKHDGHCTFWIWHKTDTYARNKIDTIRLTILMSRLWDKWINWKRGPNTTPRWSLCKPPGYWHILNTKYLDIDIKNIIETIKKNGPTNLLNDITNWEIEEIDGQKTIFYKERNYIPKDQDLQCDIVKMFHDHEIAGHLGELETYTLVKVHYWWPRMHMFIKNYVQGCSHCQQFKINRSPANLLTNQLLGPKPLVLLQTVPWTWSQISHLSMAMTQSWSW